MIDNNLANVQCAIASIEVVRQGDEFVLVEHCVLSGAVLRAFAASVGLPAEVGDAGLVDLDRDGDLDVVFQLGTWGHWHPFWIENTGFEATQPLAGDLDGDGAVGASDLTMLLGGWTGS